MMNEERGDIPLQHWKEQTKDQSRLQCYLKLNREYSLVSVRYNSHRHLLRKYRLSDHQLTIERDDIKRPGYLKKSESVTNVDLDQLRRRNTSPPL